MKILTTNIEELIEKAKRLVNQENFKDALEILEKLYKNNPISEEVKNSLIDTLFAYGGYLNDDYSLKYNEAKEMFKRILQIDPKNYRAHYNLGIANFNLENIDEAKQCYEEAIRLKPDYKYCFYNIGLIYEREGNLQEALKYYDKALEITPTHLKANQYKEQLLKKKEKLTLEQK